ncbi:hypothetical protein GCM10020000_28670 [Streptomyces olivoverticillatus]
MGRYVIRRLLQMIPVFIGSTFLIFFMVYALGDPVAALFGDKAPDPATAARIRQELYLDQPLWKQYLHYMGQILTGNFGTAFNGQKVTELMYDAFPVTLRLTLVAIVFEIVIGITLGLLSGLRRGRSVDTSVLLVTLVVVSVPTFVSGYVLQYLFGVKWQVVSPSVSPAAPPRRTAAARRGAGARLARLRHPADPHLHRRELPRRLPAHGRRQGPAAAPRRHPAPCCATPSSPWPPSSAPTWAR